MELEYLIFDENNKKLVSTISKENEFLVEKISKPNELIDEKNIKYRVGFRENENGKIFCISSHKKYIKSSRLFNYEMDILFSSVSKVGDAVEAAEKFTIRQINILIHNLKTINAHSIQDIFYLIPQDILSKGTMKDINKEIKNIIKNNMDKTTELLFKILKNNIQMKAEFSVFSKLYEENPLLNIKEFNLYNSFMNVIYNFYPDFIDKKIRIDIKKIEALAFYDYESVHVALFHMIDNIVKYIKKDSELTIDFIILIDEVEMILDMISIRIENDEIIKIFEDGYSGRYAVSSDKSGKGIGMARVKKLLELNKGAIEVQNLGNIADIYSKNQFKLKFKNDIKQIR